MQRATAAASLPQGGAVAVDSQRRQPGAGPAPFILSFDVRCVNFRRPDAYVRSNFRSDVGVRTTLGLRDDVPYYKAAKPQGRTGDQQRHKLHKSERGTRRRAEQTLFWSRSEKRCRSESPKSVAIDVSAMVDFHDSDDQGAVVNLVEDAIVALTHTVLFVAAQFDAVDRTWLRNERLNLCDNSLAVLARQRFDLFRSRWLDEQFIVCHGVSSPARHPEKTGSARWLAP